MHALTRNPVHHTIKIKGVVTKKPITILTDSGSTHNFLDTEVDSPHGH